MLMFTFLFTIGIPGRAFPGVVFGHGHRVEGDAVLCWFVLFLMKITLKVYLPCAHFRNCDIFGMHLVSMLMRGGFR